MKIKNNKFFIISCIYFLIYILSFSANSTTNLSQKINVGFRPNGGVKIYPISAGDDSRVVVDLGHFKQGDTTNKRIKVGTISVEVTMSKSEHKEEIELEIFNKKMLENYSWKYENYLITNFIDKSSPNSIKIIVENLHILLQEPSILDPGDEENGYNFGVDSGEIKHLIFEFDLVLEIEGISNTMFGFSASKRPTSGQQEAYVNIKDLVTGIIRGNAGMAF